MDTGTSGDCYGSNKTDKYSLSIDLVDSFSVEVVNNRQTHGMIVRTPVQMSDTDAYLEVESLII